MYTVERLLRVSRGEESARTTIDYPLEHLVACHRRIEERLEMLERAGAHLAGRPDDALEAIDAAFRYFDSSGVLHTADEEQSLFPRLRPRLLPDELEMVARLDREHREAEALYAELKAAVARLRKDPHNEQLGEEYRNLVKRFTELYNSHIRLEDNELVRVAKRDLTRQELDAISREMKQRRNLF